MTGALLSLADKSGTSEPHLVAIYRAKLINQAWGGPFIRPWEVEELPDEWIDASLGMAVRAPAMAQGKAAVEDRVAEWRKGHSGYKQ